MKPAKKQAQVAILEPQSACKTVQECLQASSKSLSALRKDNPDETFKLVTRLIIKINDSINIGTRMNDSQIIECVSEIMSHYFYLKVEDLMLCFHNGKSGIYNKELFGMQESIIFGWLEKYSTQRMQCAEDINRDSHSNMKEEEKQAKGYGFNKTRN